jgi:hypothetical protein
MSQNKIFVEDDTSLFYTHLSLYVLHPSLFKHRESSLTLPALHFVPWSLRSSSLRLFTERTVHVPPMSLLRKPLLPASVALLVASYVH